MFRAKLSAAVIGGLLALAVFVPLPASANDAPPADVTCTDLTLTLNVPESQAVATYTVPTQTFVQQCTSMSGAQLMLVLPVGDVTVSLEAHTSQTQRFVVANVSGEQASAKLTVVRP